VYPRDSISEVVLSAILVRNATGLVLIVFTNDHGLVIDRQKPHIQMLGGIETVWQGR
jgi:hypothetical protein